MIADAIGVTKAAVYHQFRTKEEIVVAAVERRRMVITLQHDPVVIRLLAEHEPFQQFMERLYRVLIGREIGTEARVQLAMILTAIGGAVTGTPSSSTSMTTFCDPNFCTSHGNSSISPIELATMHRLRERDREVPSPSSSGGS